MIPDPLPTPARLAIKVKPSVEKIIRQGHPWVFEKGITKINKEGKAGDLAIIFDSKKNQLLALGLYDPQSVIRIKILSLQKEAIDQQWFDSKIKQAFQKRLSLFDTDTNAYRLLHGENDGLPGFIADVYHQVLVIKLYSAIWIPYLQAILKSLVAVSKCSVAILRLNRQLQKNPQQLYGYQEGQLLLGSLPNDNIHFKEHGVQFCANVRKGHKTGFFLDHRHNRKRVGELAAQKKVLDVFAYAGGFSVHAMAGGATTVTSLDISAPALALAEQNMGLNFPNAPHQTLVADAFQGMAQLYQEGKRFDLIIVDPPSFAKKESEVERALYQYARLAKAAVKLVTDEGILLLASCSSRVTKDQFYATALQAIQEMPVKWEEIERSEHDVDHPIGFKEGAYLKSIYIKMETF